MKGQARLVLCFQVISFETLPFTKSFRCNFLCWSNRLLYHSNCKLQMGKEERDATGKTMLVAQLTIHAWKEMVIVTAMTTALVPWFVATITVLGMDLMAGMIAVQVNLF